MSGRSRTGAPGATVESAPGRSGPEEVPGLSVVEMEVCSRCNRRCSYCPVSLDPMPPVPARMSDEVFLRTVEQLERVSFAGRISYHLYNEPLLRTDLARLVAIVAERLPNALQILNTNGDLLNERRFTDLRQAGIDYFYVTRHSPGDYPERPFQVLQTWQDLTLTNRGGTLTHLPMPKPRTTRTPCWAPSEMLIVTVTGDVLLCYEDADREHVMGNIMRSELPDIWNSERFRAIRERLRHGERSVDGMCMKCSNVSHSRPGLSALEDTVLDASGLTRRSPAAVAVLKRRSTEARTGRS
ncbi:radical SAM/SPASM domain-containing protein [Kibdelosporangium persicum]|uniref:S-adenosyl-L-methionine-dependent 2-deoxy-scyllo-inosamine dehydrogenase n=2 Tax=Kibdelosporangium persicum TaxID=2698649 RepID=A0ABX2FDU9_9PSEU|nr:S-adenosyl-L-methionine-dependent 2-deoxy-scyllo-inosamine dehydrogenase [Kibdelosporangium persicum]